LTALDSPDQAIQQGALVALLTRRNPAGGREILDRMSRMKEEWKSIIRQHHGRMTGALRDAILSTDSAQCENGYRVTLLFHEYDLIPALLSALESPTHPSADQAAKTLVELVELLYEELAGTRDPTDRRDPQVIRRCAISSLEQSVLRYGQHKRREVLECFLLLVGRDDVTVKQILQNPHHPAFLVVLDSLSKNPKRGIIRLLLSFLDDPHVPSAALAAISRRADARFIHYLLQKIGREPSVTVAQNLKRIESIPWLSDGQQILDQMDDADQHAAVRLAVMAAIPRQQAFATVEYLLLRGKPGGRREAARALADFQGTDANLLAMRVLNDSDPQVQANIVRQLRGRGIPGVLPNLLELVESPHLVVRRAARESLSEFNFKRFLAAYDMLDEEVRRSTGLLVKKIDTECLPLTKEELASPIRARRLRGLAIARSIEAVGELEDAIIALLDDEDHMVRVEAATTLAHSPTPTSRQSLKEALNDTSEIVRQAAQRSLQTMSHTGGPAEKDGAHE
jgi:hypothetical protein